MKINQYQQSGFIFERDNGFKLALDIGSYTPVEHLKGVSVDAMIVSHLHGDHLSVEQIRALAPKKLYLSRECIDALAEEVVGSEIVEIKSGQATDIGGISVLVFDVDHGPNIKVVPQENFGFLFDIDGEKVYFAGDMFHPSGIDVTNLEADRALIPVGGFYTFGAIEAADFIKTFKKVGEVIPMHHEKNPETRGEFLKLIQ